MPSTMLMQSTMSATTTKSFRTPLKTPSKKMRSFTKATPATGKRATGSKALGGVFDKVIVQRYMERPSLYKGKKFDIRAFMVILCSKPWFVLGHTGYARVCLSDFKMRNFGKKQVQESTGKLAQTAQRLIHETTLSV